MLATSKGRYGLAGQRKQSWVWTDMFADETREAARRRNLADRAVVVTAS